MQVKDSAKRLENLSVKSNDVVQEVLKNMAAKGCAADETTTDKSRVTLARNFNRIRRQQIAEGMGIKINQLVRQMATVNKTGAASPAVSVIKLREVSTERSTQDSSSPVKARGKQYPVPKGGKTAPGSLESSTVYVYPVEPNPLDSPAVTVSQEVTVPGVSILRPHIATPEGNVQVVSANQDFAVVTISSTDPFDSNRDTTNEDDPTSQEYVEQNDVN